MTSKEIQQVIDANPGKVLCIQYGRIDANMFRRAVSNTTLKRAAKDIIEVKVGRYVIWFKGPVITKKQWLRMRCGNETRTVRD